MNQNKFEKLYEPKQKKDITSNTFLTGKTKASNVNS